MDSILAAVTEVTGATENMDSQTQIQRMPPKNNQPFKLFYSELVTLASLCKFKEELSDADKQKVIDLFLLNKIIFSIHDRAAQKKLFKEKEINLTKAIKIIEVPKSSGAILSHISTQTEQVSIDVYTDAGGSHEIQFVVDTGSDWTVMMRLGLSPQDLKTPTKQMQSTATALRGKNEPSWIYQSSVAIRQQNAQSDIVVFEEVTTSLLSITALKDLDTVRINVQKTSKAQQSLVNKIVVPFDEGEVYLSSTIVQQSENGSREETTKKRFIEEFRDVFQT